MPETRERHKPIVVVDTAELSEEKWLEYRRQGLGGSDAAAALGVSPFATARDLYYDKLNIAPVGDADENWVAMEVGRRLEELVAKIFKKKMGCKLGTLKKMLRHPKYPFMLADIDYLALFPDGTTAILECKTTNYNARDKWFDGAKEIVPFNYELQGRHYMAVMDVDRVYFCCLYGNNENEVIIRRVDRDLDLEAELIALEEDFWVSHVKAQNPPKYTEDGDLIAESVRRHFGAADTAAPEVTLDGEYGAQLALLLELQQQKSLLDKQSKELESRMDKIKGLVAAKLGAGCYASCDVNGETYAVTYKPVLRQTIGKDALLRLNDRLPEVYKEYVTVSESRRFQMKPKPAERETETAAA